MSLYRPVDGVLDSKGPLSRTIHPAVLSEVYKRVKLVGRRVGAAPLITVASALAS